MKLFQVSKSSVIKVIKTVIEVLGIIISIFGTKDKDKE
jgi:hypothetical protein